jgi:C3HC4-type zinc finger (RING finger) protein
MSSKSRFWSVYKLNLNLLEHHTHNASTITTTSLQRQQARLKNAGMSLSTLTNFSLDDRVELCDILFKHRFYNQYYRKRSFLSCQKLKSYADQLAELGYFYSGREIARHITLDNQIFRTFLFLTCVFCKFAYRVPSDETECFDFDELKKRHDRNGSGTFKCRMRFLNVPIRDGLGAFNVHEIETSSYGTVSMTKLPRQELLTAEEASDPKNKWVTCMICSEREINVAFLPCGCVVMCSFCIVSYNSDLCPKCNVKVKGYSKVIIT